MEFMLIVKSGRGCETGQKPSDELMAAVAKYTHDMRRAGALVELARLHPSEKGARVKVTGSERVVTDGPFAETKELIGGYWIIRANSMNEAIAWAKSVPAPEEGCEIEIRQFLETEVFFPETAAERARPQATGR